eukprot:m.65492 g.65492  ORF g.65492 m.65492 type:complete len:529 (+) comp23565_c0_seq1:62-1648(+)
MPDCIACRLYLPTLLWVIFMHMAKASGLHVLEPAEGKAIHCAGQDDVSFSNYAHFMDTAAPAMYMTYTGLANLERSWFVSLNASLHKHESANRFFIPQIGLALPSGDALSRVGSGGYDAQLVELVAGLELLNRPVFIRVGYEFNGQWNNYSATDYQTAWSKIVGAWRSIDKLKSEVAAVWDFSCDAQANRLNYTKWLPQDTDAAPDWWGVNIFSGNSHASSPCVQDFVAHAATMSMPVMLGESTPRGFGVLNDALSLVHLLQTNTNHRRSTSPRISDDEDEVDLCIGVENALTTDNTPLVTWNCGPGPNQLWRINHDRLLLNEDGKCVGLSSSPSPSSPSSSPSLASSLQANRTFSAVIAECGSGGPAPSLISLSASGQLSTTNPYRVRQGDGARNNDGEGDDDGQRWCLSAPNNAVPGSRLKFVPCSADTTLWQFNHTGISKGKGNFSDWFAPYLDLVAHPSVKAFCYIDWFWPKFSNSHFNWYTWGDCRVELNESSVLGNKFKFALHTNSIIHASDRASLCSQLDC